MRREVGKQRSFGQGRRVLGHPSDTQAKLDAKINTYLEKSRKVARKIKYSQFACQPVDDLHHPTLKYLAHFGKSNASQ